MSTKKQWLHSSEFFCSHYSKTFRDIETKSLLGNIFRKELWRMMSPDEAELISNWFTDWLSSGDSLRTALAEAPQSHHGARYGRVLLLALWTSTIDFISSPGFLTLRVGITTLPLQDCHRINNDYKAARHIADIQWKALLALKRS